MKKTFTFFAISALFLMLLFPVSVKADPIVKSFQFTSSAQNDDASDDNCNGGTVSGWNTVTTSDFHFSGALYSVVKTHEYNSERWTGFDSGAKACTREDVSLTAGHYTFTLRAMKTEHSNDFRVPQITVDNHTYSIDNVNWVNDNEEKNLQYEVKISTSGDYPILITCVDGDKDKFWMQKLTITPNCTQHTVTVAADDNNKGTVAGDGSYCENSEVTVTATPNAGYNFVNWTDNNNSNAEVSTNASYTFTLTANVSYRANFAACEGAAVTVNRNNNDYGTVTGEGSYCAGAQVDLEAIPESGYRFVNWTVTSGSADINDVNSASAHFTMSDPAAAVTVQANFEVDLCFASLTVQVEDAFLPYGAVSASKGYPTTMIFKEKQADGSAYRTGCNGRGFMQVQEEGDRELFIPVNITTAGNYKVKARSGQDKKTYINIYAITGDGETITYNSTTYYKKTYKRINEGQGESFAYSDYTDVVSLPIGVCLIGLYSEWSWAAYDEITITCTDGTVFCPNTITMQKIGDVSAADPTSTPANTAMAGVEVTVTADEPSDANHYFSGWTASSNVTFEDATALSTTFVMPAEDVTITANYGEVVSSALTFSAVEGGSITSATAGGNDISSGDNVVSGTSVTLTAAANSNYVFINWTDNNNNDAVVSTNAAFTFSMPATATAYTANFAQVDNKIITGTSETVIESNGPATLTVTSVSDFDAFNHNVLKFAYSDMAGKYKGQKVAIDEGYSSASSAGATGFGFYYKTEKADDHVAFCFEVSNGQQVKWELQATNNVWKYYYFAHPEAADWEHSGIFIYMNGDDGGNHTAYKDGGAFYISEIAATSITYKPDIDTYTYTRELSADYGTLCLPMDGSVSGATLYSVAGKQQEGGKLYIVLEEKDATLEAGEPYIFETDGATLTATMSGPHSPVKANANGLVGTYQKITAPAYSDPVDLNYVLALDNSNNTVFKKVGADVTVGAYRAYINIQNAVDYSPASAAPGRKYIRFGIEGTEEEQAVEMIYDDASLRTRKIMQNGHLYILRDGHLFTAQGTQIK